jgi:thioredoxin 1
MAKVVELNQENFREVTSQDGIVLVDCWAEWCRNCDEFAEAYGRVASRYPSHTFASLDTQKEKDLRGALGIQHIPSLMLFRDGLLLFNQPGNFDEATIGDVISQAESLDMDAVRAEIEASERESGDGNGS